MSKVQKMRDKLAHIADKSREEFESKRRELEEEMSKGRANMEKIQRGLRNKEIIDHPVLGIDPSESPTKKNARAGAKKPGGGFGTGLVSMNSVGNAWGMDPAIFMPTGLRVSDWCFNGKLDSMPPVVKSNGVYENIRLLGRGSFGDVYLVKNIDDNKL